jgi:OOP family OmpA-OmpF porin
MFKRIILSTATVLGLTLGFTPIAAANYPAAPVVVAPTVNNQIRATSTEIQVNANLDNVQSVTVTVNGKTVKAEVTSDGKVIVGTLIGPKDNVDVKIATINGVQVDVEVTKPEEPISLANVNFAVNSVALSKNARALLDQVARIVKNKGFKSVSLIGFTDPDGSKAYNQGLSLARARAVENYLSSKGVKVKFSVDAQADENPVADNSTKQGKALNRRVEIVVG